MRRHEDADRRRGRPGRGLVHVPGRQVRPPRPSRREGAERLRGHTTEGEVGDGDLATIGERSSAFNLSPLTPLSPSPVLGYLGCIGHWFDWPLVIRLAEALPQARIELVGPCAVAPPDDLPANVRLLPACKQSEAAGHLARFSAGLIPFRQQCADGRRRSDQVLRLSRRRTAGAEHALRRDGAPRPRRRRVLPRPARRLGGRRFGGARPSPRRGRDEPIPPRQQLDFAFSPERRVFDPCWPASRMRRAA